MDFQERASYEHAQEALEYIREHVGGAAPLTAIVLGSGLAEVAEAVEDPLTLKAQDIPNWPGSTAPTHAGQVIFGGLAGRPIVMLQGRVHCYEGYSMRIVTFPVRVLGMMGIRQYIATNAAGGIGYGFDAGTIAAVEDHINLMGANPLTGLNEPRWNLRFPDMTHAYSPRLLDLIDRAASECGIDVKRGVYAAFSGPSYETPAEIRAARTLGANLVGMSTVPEIIVANAMGMEAAVLSCVSNKAAGLSDAPLTMEDVTMTMMDTAKTLVNLLQALMRALDSADKRG